MQWAWLDLEVDFHPTMARKSSLYCSKYPLGIDVSKRPGVWSVINSFMSYQTTSKQFVDMYWTGSNGLAVCCIEFQVLGNEDMNVSWPLIETTRQADRAQSSVLGNPTNTDDQPISTLSRNPTINNTYLHHRDAQHASHRHLLSGLLGASASGSIRY